MIAIVGDVEISGRIERQSQRLILPEISTSPTMAITLFAWSIPREIFPPLLEAALARAIAGTSVQQQVHNSTNPPGSALDSAGNLYIADSGNHVVRKVDSSHNISTVAGQCASPCSGGFSGDGDLANGAELNTPMGVAVDGAGNLYIADYGNHRVPQSR